MNAKALDDKIASFILALIPKEDKARIRKFKEMYIFYLRRTYNSFRRAYDLFRKSWDDFRKSHGDYIK